jgi:AcrR family transcriptional regulator
MVVSRNRVNPEHPASAGPSGRRYGGVDSNERQRQRKAKLVEAALVVFAQQGFHHTTVRDVCKQAQLTSRYFYESFDSMKALFHEVYASVNRELMRRTIVALASCQPDPDLLAEASLRAFLEYIREDPLRARVALVDALSIDREVNDLAEKASQDFAHLIAGFMHQLFPRLEEAGLDFKMLAIGLVGANTRLATHWVNEHCQTPMETVLHNLLSLFRASSAYARQLHDALPPRST